jgi:hypothetical protein
MENIKEVVSGPGPAYCREICFAGIEPDTLYRSSAEYLSPGTKKQETPAYHGLR